MAFCITAKDGDQFIRPEDMPDHVYEVLDRMQDGNEESYDFRQATHIFAHNMQERYPGYDGPAVWEVVIPAWGGAFVGGKSFMDELEVLDEFVRARRWEW